MTSILLFIDFDGVLRPHQSPAGVFCPHCLEHFESLLREFEQVDVVIASDWRIFHPLDRLRQLFSAEVQPRIVGATPWLGSFDDGCRYHEIMAFLEERFAGSGSRPPWLAIDDTPCLYPDAVHGGPVLFTDPDRALDADATRRVRDYVLQLRDGC